MIGGEGGDVSKYLRSMYVYCTAVFLCMYCYSVVNLNKVHHVTFHVLEAALDGYASWAWAQRGINEASIRRICMGWMDGLVYICTVLYTVLLYCTYKQASIWVLIVGTGHSVIPTPTTCKDASKQGRKQGRKQASCSLHSSPDQRRHC